jgi:hypothetical protein
VKHLATHLLKESLLKNNCPKENMKKEILLFCNMRISLIAILFFVCAVSFGQRRTTLNTLFYERTSYLPKGLIVSIGPTIAYGKRWNATDTITSPVYSVGTYKARPRLGWTVDIGKYWITDRLILLNRFDLNLHYVRFNGSEKFNGEDIYGQSLEEKRIFHENRFGLTFSTSNIYAFGKGKWIQNELGLFADYAYKRSTCGEYNALPRAYSEKIRSQVYYGLGYGMSVSDGLYATFEVEVPILELFPNTLGDIRMNYFHSHYCPIVFKASLLFGKHKPEKPCDAIKKGPSDVSADKPGKHKGGSLFGPDVKKKRKRK